MFAFDQALLPQLTTRKALLLIDFQNDFTDSNGALPSTDPEGFVHRTAKLVREFRGKGDVVWIQSQFTEPVPVPVDTGAIIVSDAPPGPRHKNSSRRALVPVLSVEPNELPDEEAFLSQTEASCVRLGSWGAQMSSAMEEIAEKRDLVLAKSHYSGFNGTPLLRSLRAKMVMEVFLCGSMANVGVYATALDAAGHGMSITIVEDCCGYRNVQRQLLAVRNLIELTGCEIASAEEIVESLNLQSGSPACRSQSTSSAPPPVLSQSTQSRSGASQPADNIVTSMAGLRLDAGRSGTAPDHGAAASCREPQANPQLHKTKRPETGGNDTKDAVTADQRQDVDGGNDGKIETSRELSADVSTRKTKDSLDAPTTSPHRQTPTPTMPQLIMMQEATSDDNSAEENILQRGLGEGDTDIFENVLPHELQQVAFDQLRNEVQWQHMLHQGSQVPRLVAVQGEVAQDGSMPVYRHPSDESPPLLPFSPTVSAIRAETARRLGHPLNHVLIQFYRGGKDYISEHSDKTLDIVRGSYIANLSLGAERTMVFRTKRQGKDASRADASPPRSTKRQVQRAQLPHNSLCRMGLETNMKWLHSVRQDKRADREKTPAELAYNSGRISLTFRRIGTFLDRDERIIWGQGATGKTRDAAKPVINGQSPEAVEMLKAFGAENNSSIFDWEARYGKGFDVLHMSSSPRLFESADTVANMRVWLMLADMGINYAKGSIALSASEVSDDASTNNSPMRFVDNDADKSVVVGDMAIMLYLDAVYGDPPAAQPFKPDLASRFTRFQRALKLADLWKRQDKSTSPSKALLSELATWDGYASSASFMSNTSTPDIVDFATWPVLHAVVENYGLKSIAEMRSLGKYYASVAERASTKKVRGKTALARGMCFG